MEPEAAEPDFDPYIEAREVNFPRFGHFGTRIPVDGQVQIWMKMSVLNVAAALRYPFKMRNLYDVC